MCFACVSAYFHSVCVTRVVSISLRRLSGVHVRASSTQIVHMFKSFLFNVKLLLFIFIGRFFVCCCCRCLTYVCWLQARSGGCDLLTDCSVLID